MRYSRWYERMKMRRRFGNVARNRGVQIASALGALAGLVIGMRRWRAARNEASL